MNTILYFILFLNCVPLSLTDDVFDVLKHPNYSKNLMKQCGNSKADRIKGGVNANLGQFPYVARLGYRVSPEITRYRCGGALISQEFVITVAHCLSKDLIAVQLGEHNLLTEIDCDSEMKYCADPPIIYKPIKIIPSKDFNRATGSNDIGLIKLNKKVKITEWISPICLPYSDILKKDFIGEKADLAGFGLLNANYAATILQTIKLPIINITECMKSFRKFAFGDGIICAGGEKNKDSCDGDSGSPLMKALNSETGPRYFLIGLVSYGRTNCNSQSPAMYTRITYYMKWILDNMN